MLAYGKTRYKNRIPSRSAPCAAVLMSCAVQLDLSELSKRFFRYQLMQPMPHSHSRKKITLGKWVSRASTLLQRMVRRCSTRESRISTKPLI